VLVKQQLKTEFEVVYRVFCHLFSYLWWVSKPTATKNYAGGILRRIFYLVRSGY